MTGSFARTSLQAEGSRPQGWMPAPVIRHPRAAGCDVPSPRATDVLPNKVFLVLLLVRSHRNRAVDGCNPHTIARHRSG